MAIDPFGTIVKIDCMLLLRAHSSSIASAVGTGHVHLRHLDLIAIRLETDRLLDDFLDFGERHGGSAPFGARQIDEGGDGQAIDGAVLVLPFLDGAWIFVIGRVGFPGLELVPPTEPVLRPVCPGCWPLRRRPPLLGVRGVASCSASSSRTSLHRARRH